MFGNAFFGAPFFGDSYFGHDQGGGGDDFDTPPRLRDAQFRRRFGGLWALLVMLWA